MSPVAIDATTRTGQARRTRPLLPILRLATARRVGCREARPDTGWFMTDAHRLYRAAEFEECAPYAESEVPAEFEQRWQYMRLENAPESPMP